MLRTAELDYHLPPGRIATRPAEPRDAARMLVTRRAEPARIEHATVRDLPVFLRAGDCLVFNTSRVVPARFSGRKSQSGGRVGGLYLHDAPDATGWVVLLEGKGFRPGVTIELDSASGAPAGVRLVLAEPSRDEEGAWRVEVHDPGCRSTLALLDAVGAPPLPPYILRARREADQPESLPEDRQRYQTVYAEPPGSVAAPTAGLHFTPALLRRLDEAGIRRADVVLHVGVGTFRPIATEVVEDHPMHAEWCSMSEGARDVVRRTRAERGGGRVICVGTTAARTVESYASIEPGAPWPASLETRLLITPGYRWRWTDGLMTNFHLPRSTLLALVASLFPVRGAEAVIRVYSDAIERGYRFYSFGDAMLILP